jgi:hypothetical protein
MQRCVDIARQSGLKNVYWSGHTGISGRVADVENSLKDNYLSDEARLAGSYARYAGCQAHIRNCDACSFNQQCQLKKYIPRLST